MPIILTPGRPYASHMYSTCSLLHHLKRTKEKHLQSYISGSLGGTMRVLLHTTEDQMSRCTGVCLQVTDVPHYAPT